MATDARPTIRVGIAGLGGAARQMVPALLKHPNVAVVAAAADAEVVS